MNAKESLNLVQMVTEEILSEAVDTKLMKELAVTHAEINRVQIVLAQDIVSGVRESMDLSDADRSDIQNLSILLDELYDAFDILDAKLKPEKGKVIYNQFSLEDATKLMRTFLDYLQISKMTKAEKDIFEKRRKKLSGREEIFMHNLMLARLHRINAAYYTVSDIMERNKNVDSSIMGGINYLKIAISPVLSYYNEAIIKYS